MPKNLASLTIQALDEFHQLRNLQEILEVTLDLFNNSDEHLILRAEVLLSLYQAQMNCHLEELRNCLEALNHLAIGKPPEAES